MTMKQFSSGTTNPIQTLLFEVFGPDAALGDKVSELCNKYCKVKIIWNQHCTGWTICFISSAESPKLSRFHDDVYESLMSLLQTERLVQVNRYSPYFYGLGKHIFYPGILV
jgi:hypothetical protein